MTGKKVAFLFPGQGAQEVGMGKDFFESYPVARETFEEGEAVLGRRITETIFEGPAEELTETRNSQPAIYIMSVAVWRVIAQEFPELKPVVCAGLSLGEYTALTASSHISFADCLPLVRYRSEFMNEACQRTSGMMAALLGLSAEQVESLVRTTDMPADLFAANFNCPGQTVISGTVQGVEAGIEAAKALGAKRAIPLKVHGAFHSGLMESARLKLAPKIQEAPLRESGCQLVMNVPGNYVSQEKAIRSYLIDQVTHPVRWEQGIRAMEGVDAFVEIGCGQTLAGFNRKIGTAPTISIGCLADLERLATFLESGT